MPRDDYSPLLERTRKPLAVAEGGYGSADVGQTRGTPRDQVDYLQAIGSQIGPRLDFWVYTLLNDLSLESYAPQLRKQGQAADVSTLGAFGTCGLRDAAGRPKPSLEAWDTLRADLGRSGR